MGQPIVGQPIATLPILAGLASLLLALGLTPLMRAYAVRHNWVCHPRADRWSTRAVALMGGVAIAASTTLATLLLWGHFDTRALALVGSSLMMFVVGAIDDRISIKPHTKLVAQVVAAVWLVEAGLRFGLLGEQFKLWDQLFTIFWVVFIGNAFNLLDNMDGLSAGVAGVAALCLTAINMKYADRVGATLTLAMAGSCLGYLRYNRYPASIFMGDCGSLFIGHFLAASTLLVPVVGGQRSILAVVALPVLVMLIPMMDTGLVTISRKWFRRPISQGGRDHSSHRLVAIGLTEAAAVNLLWLLSLAGGLSAVAVLYMDVWFSSVLLPTIMLVVALLSWYLLRVRVYDDASSLAEVLAQTPIPLLAQHRYRRRMGEVLFDTLAVALGFYAAFVLRFESRVGEPQVLSALINAMPLMVAGHLIAYFVAGVYRGIWRYTSSTDLPRFVRAVLLGSACSVLLMWCSGRTITVSRSVLVVNVLVQFLLLAGSRVSLRLMRDRFVARSEHSRPALLVGLGEQAEPTLRRLVHSNRWGLLPTGVICEDEHSVGLSILGLPVLGTSHQIRSVLNAAAVGEVVLIDEHYPRESWDRIRRACRDMGLVARVMRNTLEVDEPPLTAVGD